MATTEETEYDLRASLSDIGERFPKLSKDDLFVLGFVRAYITESNAKAAEAVSGGGLNDERLPSRIAIAAAGERRIRSFEAIKAVV